MGSSPWIYTISKIQAVQSIYPPKCRSAATILYPKPIPHRLKCHAIQAFEERLGEGKQCLGQEVLGGAACLIFNREAYEGGN
jgi:hypothetical protein